MKMRALLLTAAVWLSCAGGLFAADSLVAVDLQAKLLTVETGKGLKAYHFKDFTEVRVNGVLAKPNELVPGMSVDLALSDPSTVVRILASGNAPPPSSVLPASPVSAARPPLGAVPGERHIIIKLRVDGNDHINVRGGALWIDHLKWEKPSEISISGRPWKPQWSGKTTDQYVGFNPPLAPFGGDAIVSVKKLQGTRNGGSDRASVGRQWPNALGRRERLPGQQRSL